MRPTFEKIMTMICHLPNRIEAEENEIIRKHDGEEMLRKLWEYREYRLDLWVRLGNKRWPNVPERPRFLHLLRDDISPDENWKNIWADENVKSWMNNYGHIFAMETSIRAWANRLSDI